MAQEIDTRPQEVNISGYGGDTLRLKITAPASLTDGMEWHAQVRANRAQETPIAASFLVTPPEVSGGPAWIVLSAEDTALLASSGTVSRSKSGSVSTFSQTYSGVWDCQINDPANPDPVTTLVQGNITLDADVTRLP